MDAAPSASSQLNKGDDYASITKVKYCLKLNFFHLLQGLGTQFSVIRQPLYFPNNMCSSKIGLGELQNLWILCHQYYFNIQWSMMKFMIYSKWICGLRSARRGRSGLNRVGITVTLFYSLFFNFSFFYFPLYCTCILFFIVSLFTWPGSR